MALAPIRRRGSRLCVPAPTRRRDEALYQGEHRVSEMTSPYAKLIALVPADREHLKLPGLTCAHIGMEPSCFGLRLVKIVAHRFP